MARDNNELDAWLDSLTAMYHGTTSKTVKSSVTVKTKVEPKPLISVPVDSLFELYANLHLAGFEKDEALVIVASVIRDYEQRAN